MDEVNPLIVLQTVENVKYAKPSCCAYGVPQSSQSAAEHMFRHALIGLIIPLEDKIDRHKMVIMALIHDITDFRSWDGVQQKKQLNMTYLACNLPTGTAKDLGDYWSEYWEGKSSEARLAQEICAFEHLISLDEDGITIRDFYQSNISSPVLQKWLEFLDSSRVEMKDLQNTASLGSSYWKNPDKNMGLLDEVINTKLATSPLPYIRMLKDMSTIKRKGWIKRSMDEPDVESNASHSWRVALICFLFSPKNEAIQCTILGLIHDLGEIVIGDVIPAEGIRKEDKWRHERFGQKFIVHVCLTRTMESYFREFETGESIAAQITHEADSLECRVQAVKYILRYPQFEKLFEFLEPTLEAVYFQDLTNLLLREEMSLREKQSPEKQPRLTIIFVIGGPGVGKDTQCNRLADEFDFYHIPTGDLLRKEVKRTGSRYAEFIQDSMNIGFNVPAELMISLLIAVAEGFRWILNGFPRNFDQLFTFEQLVSPHYSTLFLDCPEEMTEDEFEEVLRARLRKRATSSLRSDDEVSVIQKRLKGYRDEKPLRIHLHEKGSSRTINSTGSEEEVFALAKEGIKRLLGAT